MNKVKIQRLLGLAMRSGKLSLGEYACLDTIKSGKAKYVFIANDASDNTKKRLNDKSNYRGLPVCMEFDRYELGQAIGRQYCMSIAVKDRNFAQGIARETGGNAIEEKKDIYNSRRAWNAK